MKNNLNKIILYINYNFVKTILFSAKIVEKFYNAHPKLVVKTIQSLLDEEVTMLVIDHAKLALSAVTIDEILLDYNKWINIL